VADSTQLKVGDLVVAIGNPFGLEGTMTVGFVSALGRSLPVSSSASVMGPSFTIPDIIQTDAPINPGNSGGVLLNDVGELVGVPTAIESQVGQNAGIGFAVPSSIVQNVVPQLIDAGKVEHPWIGISGMTLTSDLAKAMDLSDEQRGALVISVTPGSPAEKAGLVGGTQEAQINGVTEQVGGDLIVAINGQTVNTFDDVVSYLSRSTQVGDTITLTILRDGKEQTVELTLAARPDGLSSQDQPSQDEQGQAQPQPQPGSGGSAWLGIQAMTLSPEMAQAMDLDQDQAGVLVGDVVSGSPADDAGLRGSFESATIDGQAIRIGGDVIVAADGDSITSMEDLQSFLQEAEPGQRVALTVLRDGRQRSIDVTLGTRPSSSQ
jgi:serine protease Do